MKIKVCALVVLSFILSLISCNNSKAIESDVSYYWCDTWEMSEIKIPERTFLVADDGTNVNYDQLCPYEEADYWLEGIIRYGERGSWSAVVLDGWVYLPQGSYILNPRRCYWAPVKTVYLNPDDVNLPYQTPTPSIIEPDKVTLNYSSGRCPECHHKKGKNRKKSHYRWCSKRKG